MGMRRARKLISLNSVRERIPQANNAMVEKVMAHCTGFLNIKNGFYCACVREREKGRGERERERERKRE